jgi:hypothetical protein
MKRGGNVTAYLNADELEKLEAQVEKEGRPANQIMKQAIREYIDNEVDICESCARYMCGCAHDKGTGEPGCPVFKAM